MCQTSQRVAICVFKVDIRSSLIKSGIRATFCFTMNKSFWEKSNISNEIFLMKINDFSSFQDDWIYRRDENITQITKYLSK